MSTRQDTVEDRLTIIEDKLQALQVGVFNFFLRIYLLKVFFQKDQMEALPEVMARCLQQHQERADQRRNFLHPDAAVASITTPALPTPAPPLGSPLLLPHSR